MTDPFSPAGRFDEKRRLADQQRAMERKATPMTDKLEPTQVECTAADAFCSLNMLTGPTWRERVAMLLARHRTTHSGEGRSYGAGEDAWERLKQRCCTDPANAKRCVMVSKEDFIAALTPQGDGEPDK